MPRKHNLASAFLQQKTPQNFVVHHLFTTQYVVLLAPPVGLEPTTYRLTVERSTG